MAILEFRGEYAWMSNMYNCPVKLGNIQYSNSEAAYQSLKATDKGLRKVFSRLPGPEAKTLGRKIDIRPDWDEIKDDAMYLVVLYKFAQNHHLRKKLRDTGDEEIVEGNYWHDTYWGIDKTTGLGENKMGKTLMRVREAFRTTSPALLVVTAFACLKDSLVIY